MAFSRPTLADLVSRTRNDIASRLTDPDLLRRADGDVFARVIAGVSHALHGFIDWLSRQVIYDTAEAALLERWASIWGISRIPGVVATGSAVFSLAAGATSATLPDGARLQRGDGVLYVVPTGGVIAGVSASFAIQAVDAGSVGNISAATNLTLLSPVTDLSSIAVASSVSGGADIESDDSMRARLLGRIQQPPHGGNRYDYERWALEVAGVTRAWVYPLEGGANAVKVRFVRDNDAGSIIPDAGEVATVQAYIDTLRPVTAAVTVAAPVAVPLDFTIGVAPNTADVKTAVTAELASLINAEAVPGGTLYLSRIRAAISAAVGEYNYTMTTPAANVVSTTGNITTLGTITWV